MGSVMQCIQSGGNADKSGYIESVEYYGKFEVNDLTDFNSQCVDSMDSDEYFDAIENAIKSQIGSQQIIPLGVLQIITTYSNIVTFPATYIKKQCFVPSIDSDKYCQIIPNYGKSKQIMNELINAYSLDTFFQEIGFAQNRKYTHYTESNAGYKLYEILFFDKNSYFHNGMHPKSHLKQIEESIYNQTKTYHWSLYLIAPTSYNNGELIVYDDYFKLDEEPIIFKSNACEWQWILFKKGTKHKWNKINGDGLSVVFYFNVYKQQ